MRRYNIKELCAQRSDCKLENVDKLEKEQRWRLYMSLHVNGVHRYRGGIQATKLLGAMVNEEGLKPQGIFVEDDREDSQVRDGYMIQNHIILLSIIVLPEHTYAAAEQMQCSCIYGNLLRECGTESLI